MKWLAWFSKLEPRGDNISNKVELEITDLKEFRRLFCIELCLLTVGGSTLVMMVVHILLGIFHPEAFSNYGMTIGIFTIVLAKIVPHALFPYNKDSKYPCTIFYAFGVAQLIMVGMVFLLVNRLDSLWRVAHFMGDDKNQVFTSLLFQINFVLQSTLVMLLFERINIPTRNDYILKTKSWEIQKCKPSLLILFLIYTLLLLFYIINLVILLNKKL
ncbi:uncharacterized protein LOC130676004 [Microplitis mediator]|uniref:uncharacterized protein LOC130676004 n=1 Tax=Microplitis mediator TaxID=375433 RepID=UPI0025558510|nr:uncharacterized protein LOC130676004 [Microplitis mediator]